MGNYDDDKERGRTDPNYSKGYTPEGVDHFAYHQGGKERGRGWGINQPSPSYVAPQPGPDDWKGYLAFVALPLIAPPAYFLSTMWNRLENLHYSETTRWVIIGIAIVIMWVAVTQFYRRTPKLIAQLITAIYFAFIYTKVFMNLDETPGPNDYLWCIGITAAIGFYVGGMGSPRRVRKKQRR